MTSLRCPKTDLNIPCSCGVVPIVVEYTDGEFTICCLSSHCDNQLECNASTIENVIGMWNKAMKGQYIQSIQNLIENGYISSRPHPTEPLQILNYTPLCQYERYWNDITLMCRGLIVDHDYNVIGRPFKKFFNWEEHLAAGLELPNGPFEAFEKLDGSLGIVFHTGVAWEVATRGSFESEQAIKANQLLRSYPIEELCKEKTYLVEIIYPENRIVVDYGAAERLVMLGAIDTLTGEEIPLGDLAFWGDLAKTYSFNTIQEAIQQAPDGFDNNEGYVVRFTNGLRVKIKFAEYVRIHRAISQLGDLNNLRKTIIKNYIFGEDFDLDNIPDELYNMVKDTKLEIDTEFANIYSNVYQLYQNTRSLTDKQFAIEYSNNQYQYLVFNLRKNKDVDIMIWRMILRML